MPPKSAAAAGSVTPNAAAGLDGDVTSKIWKWQSARSAASNTGASRVARGTMASPRTARAPPFVPATAFQSRARVGGLSSATSESVDASSNATRPLAPPTATTRVPTAAIAVGPSRGASAAETSTASTWVASMEERKVASGRSDVGGGTRTRYATPATSTATTTAGAPGSAAAGSTTHAIGRRTSGKTTRTARAGGAPTPPVGVSARWIAAPSSAVMAQVRRRRRPAFGASRADARSVAPPAASGARVARARSLAPSTRTTRGGACSSRSTSAKPPMAAWGCERGALARDRAEGARSRTGPEEGADPTRARPEGTSTPRKTRGGECRERDDATPESRGDACARLAVWRRRDARICTRGGNPHRARARAPANAGERF